MSGANLDASQAGAKLLLIDDDRKFCSLVSEYLETYAYKVTVRHSGAEGLEELSSTSDGFDAVILDVMIPEMDGFEVLRKLRENSRVPVLMLTARGDETDRIEGLESGADDYIPKMFSTRELLARIRAVIRRARARELDADEDIIISGMRISPCARSVTLDGEPVLLTPVEYDLLACLARSKGKVKSRGQLVAEVADRDFDVFDRSVDVHISSLRKKLGDDAKNPRFIKTVRAAGYMLVIPELSC